MKTINHMEPQKNNGKYYFIVIFGIIFFAIYYFIIQENPFHPLLIVIPNVALICLLVYGIILIFSHTSYTIFFKKATKQIYPAGERKKEACEPYWLPLYYKPRGRNPRKYYRCIDQYFVPSYECTIRYFKTYSWTSTPGNRHYFIKRLNYVCSGRFLAFEYKVSLKEKDFYISESLKNTIKEIQNKIPCDIWIEDNRIIVTRYLKRTSVYLPKQVKQHIKELTLFYEKIVSEIVSESFYQ